VMPAGRRSCTGRSTEGESRLRGQGFGFVCPITCGYKEVFIPAF
jgi:hypothetical protein